MATRAPPKVKAAKLLLDFKGKHWHDDEIKLMLDIVQDLMPKGKKIYCYY